ncbi:hypothetical protein SAMN05421743_101240 [Thalassobacillus cyri]|uniref:Uncharacterized protein n=1 Tax=Thalassobacillus cyri TaxID=571932 RepID=A0A1H3VYI5_9BACI|nr:hypothetical protein [Thalassobacillus cyri]SDZ79810.1 hypothetical protein SAMN05421743_101240 [Thalassobacillus cyri]
MVSHMGVQEYATVRNQNVEILVDFIIKCSLEKLKEKGIVASFEEPLRQKEFVRSDCSDVFDHFFKVKTFSNINGNRDFEIWAQTTCYKGNKSGRPESNKTYEIRETLIESLGLRKWLLSENKSFRTVHFTVGPTEYTYGWFESAKKNAFDLSVYPIDKFDINGLFNELNELFKEAKMEFQYNSLLEEIYNSSESTLIKEFILYMQDKIISWFEQGLPSSEVADKQANLIKRIEDINKEYFDEVISKSKYGGMNIKGKVKGILWGSEPYNPMYKNTLEKVTSKAPFIPGALQTMANWDITTKKIFDKPDQCDSISDYIRYLWSREDENRLIVRRLLLRTPHKGTINYIQDLDINGITEHNLYNGKPTSEQLDNIKEKITKICEENDIFNINDLYEELTNKRARKLLSESVRSEINNGSNIKPTFYFVEDSLGDSYEIVSFNETNLERPIAYHSNFTTGKVSPYQNMKVIRLRETKVPLAIIKAKYFSEREFGRRAKEEAYVGITTKYIYNNGSFVERYKGLPLIMFVDMDEKLIPQEYFIRRLINTGWTVFFSIETLRQFLKDIAEVN